MTSYRIIRQNRSEEVYAKPRTQEPPKPTQEEDERPYGSMIDDITSFNQGAIQVPTANQQGYAPRQSAQLNQAPPHAQAYGFGSQCSSGTGAPSHVSCWTREAPTVSTASYIPGGAILAQPDGSSQYQALFQTKLGRGTAKPRAKKSSTTTSKPRRKIPR